MRPNDARDQPLTVSEESAVDRLCDAFESARRAAVRGDAPRPDLSAFLDCVPGPLRRAVRDELVPAVPGYELSGEVLGEGAFGVVYRAVERATGRKMAVKVTRAGERDRVERLRDLLGLAHAQVVPVLEVGSHRGRPFLVMPLVEGGDLKARLAEFSVAPGHCPPSEVPARLAAIARLLAGVADGVAFLHAHAILHRDLKPANILLGHHGPMICDFGLARRVDESLQVTEHGQRVGTWAYMAPEQAAGNPIPTLAADVWSLGAILYELLTGHPPYCPPGTKLDDLLQAKEHEPLPPKPSTLNPQLPPGSDLEWVCLECLHRDPARRVGSAAELAAKLRDVAEGRRVRPAETWRQWVARAAGLVVPWPPTDRRPPAGETHYPERWKNCLRIEAATSFTAHVGVFVLAAAAVPGWALWAWFLAADTAVGWLLWAPARRSKRLTDMEQAVGHWWVGADLAAVILFWVFCPVLQPADPVAVCRFYAAYAVVRGLIFWIEGCTWWGRLHYTGLALFAAAAVIPFVGHYGPLVFASVYSGWFVWFSFQRWDRYDVRE